MSTTKDEIIEMAKAHLSAVEVRINELNAQKQNIENDINRLTAYLAQGRQKVTEASVE